MVLHRRCTIVKLLFSTSERWSCIFKQLQPDSEESEYQKTDKEHFTGGGYMTGEEYSGPPGPKLMRLVYFVGAAVAVTVAINKLREFESKSIMKEQQKQGVKVVAEIPNSSDSVAVHKALK